MRIGFKQGHQPKRDAVAILTALVHGKDLAALAFGRTRRRTGNKRRTYGNAYGSQRRTHTMDAHREDGLSSSPRKDPSKRTNTNAAKTTRKTMPPPKYGINFKTS